MNLNNNSDIEMGVCNFNYGVFRYVIESIDKRKKRVLTYYKSDLIESKEYLGRDLHGEYKRFDKNGNTYLYQNYILGVLQK